MTTRPPMLPEPSGLPPTATLWLDTDTRVLAYTATARGIIRANPCCLRITQGQLRLHPDPVPLQNALQWVCAPNGAQRCEHALTLHRLNASPLTLRLSRHVAPATGTVQAVVWLADPDLLQLDEAALRQAFDFTATEARVAVALATGTTELAQAWGVRANTVQMHVKRLLAKTHTSRQPELVGLLWRSAVLQLPQPSPGLAGGRARSALAPTQTGNDIRHT